MNYDEALKYIHTSNKFGMKLGLDNMRMLLGIMGNPEKNLKFIHIAGTNGKGSTAAYISGIFTAAGFKTGLYISPYLVEFTERIQIDRKNIPKEELAAAASFVKSCADKMAEKGMNPTEFEIVTAIAFYYYNKEQCDYIVLETGLGGRFDATNIIRSPLCSVITPIGMDHAYILGNTIAKITYEKAGIIKEGCPVISAHQHDEAVKVIKEVCSVKKCKLYILDKDNIKEKDYTGTCQIFDYKGIMNIKTKMLGKYQLENASLALLAVKVLAELYNIPVTEENIKAGIENTKWAGRTEVISDNPLLLIDGTHNKMGAVVLNEAIKRHFAGKRRIFIFGVMKDKDIDGMAKELFGSDDRVILVKLDNDRAAKPEEIKSIVAKYCKNIYYSDTIKEALEKSCKLYKKDDLICAFGSLYYIGIIRQMYR